MSKKEIPKDVLAAIRKAAKEYWGDDDAMVKYRIDTEVEAYKALQDIDFGAAASVRQEILDNAPEGESWSDRLSFIRSEIEAYEELQSGFRGVPKALVRQFKAEAEEEHPGYFNLQRDHVVQAVNAYRYTEEVRARVGPVRDLLIKMEEIVGNECYNGKIQNYGPGGVWEGEGRSFRYPVKVRSGDDVQKHWSVPAEIAPEALISGWYQFGSNELSIFRALMKIIEMIESDYGVRLADENLKKP